MGSAALCAQRVAFPVAVLWLGNEGQVVAAVTIVAAALLGFIRVTASHRIAAVARRNLLALYLRPLERGSALGLPAGDEVSAQLSVGFPVLAGWIAEGLTSLIGGMLAVPIVAAILIRSLGPMALLPVVLGGAAGALVTLAFAERVEKAWDYSWSLWRSLTRGVGDAHRGAVEWRAHGAMQSVADKLRDTERAWSASHAHARTVSAVHTWGAIGVAALVAAATSLLLRDAAPGAGQSYFQWLLVIAALPTAQTLVSGASTALSSRAEFAAVARQLQVRADEPAEIDEAVDPQAALTLDRVSFAYPPGPGESESHAVIAELTVTLPSKGGVAVIGANGSGKTTLLYLLLGILRPDAGTIRIGEAEARLDNRAWRSRIAFVPQEPFMLTHDTVAGNLRVFDKGCSEAAMTGALREAGLWDWLRARASDDAGALAQPVSHLSRGQARRVAIARALLRDADTLLLDEPEASLDTASVQELARLLTALAGRKRVVAAVHDRSLLPFASLVVDLQKPRALVREAGLAS